MYICRLKTSTQNDGCAQRQEHTHIVTSCNIITYTVQRGLLIASTVYQVGLHYVRVLVFGRVSYTIRLGPSGTVTHRDGPYCYQPINLAPPPPRPRLPLYFIHTCALFIQL